MQKNSHFDVEFLLTLLYNGITWYVIRGGAIWLIRIGWNGKGGREPTLVASGENIISMKRHRYGTKKRDVRRRRLANISEELLKMVLSHQSKSRIRCSSLTLQFVNMVQAVLYVRSERIFTATWKTTFHKMQILFFVWQFSGWLKTAHSNEHLFYMSALIFLKFCHTFLFHLAV
mgnify:CR=1 FL=1